MFNQTTYNILLTLASGDFFSGELLGAQNNISRAAISKHIKALKQLGVDIYCVTGKGYRLSHPIELLSSEKIKQLAALPQLAIGVEPVVTSTNDVLKKQLLNQSLTERSSGTTVFSEAQTSGRGRRGKTWISPLGASLYFSTHWRFEQGISATVGLSLVIGIAIVKGLKALGVTDLGLKWPNDIYYKGRKLAGILVEMEGQGSDFCDVIIGVGINVQLPSKAAKDIDQPFADIDETGLQVERNVIAATILRHIIVLVQQFETTGFAPFVEHWHRDDCFIGQPVELNMGQRCIEGIANGVDAQGAIILLINGQPSPFFGGEISVRKLTS